jgi:hypothetical protein
MYSKGTPLVTDLHAEHISKAVMRAMQTTSVSARRPHLLFSNPLALRAERLILKMKTLKRRRRAKQSKTKTRQEAVYLLQLGELLVGGLRFFHPVSVILFLNHGRSAKLKA